MKLYEILHDGYIPRLIAGDATGIALWIIILLCLAVAVISYLLGGLNFAIIISKYKFKEDIRTFGSGNAGMTNMLRTYGKSAAAFTLIGDMAKAAVSVLLVGTLLAGEAGAYIAGFFCVLGHSFPCYYGFKGGKGIVVTATMLLCLEPLVFLILFVIFALIVLSTKYLSLGSIIGMMIYPVLLNRMYPTLNGGLQEGAVPAIISVLNAVLVVWLHRENIKRLMEGKENKFSLKKKDKFVKSEKESDENK
ncbi:MAG: glycerol-3-phosphate 1-O-acyltransferase PlsY [Clostridia bacterium]|nr:glycerol-3-phosphate 1-O-acyltransferase PlsY [Clostridia bacterium]